MEEIDTIKFKEYFKILNGNNVTLISNENLDEDGDNKIIDQPNDIKLKLKNYQKTMIYEMFLREQKQGFFTSKYNFLATNIGILGDQVGCGKTLMVLGLISYKKLHKFYYPNAPASYIRYQVIKNKYNFDGKTNREDFIKEIIKYIPSYCEGFSIMDDFYLKRPNDLYINEEVPFDSIKNIPTNLIVLPHNLIRQWKNHIEKHTSLTYFFISSVRELRKIKNNGVKSLANFDIVICNASKYNDFVELSKEYRWERVFFDEAHSINIPKSKFIFAKFYWFITATYKSIISRRNTGFLRTLFQNYARRLRQNNIYDFNRFILKTDPQCVKEEFVLPDPIIHNHISEKPLWIQVIENSIDSEFPNMKEMMYAELKKDMKEYLLNFSIFTSMTEFYEKNVVLTYIKWLKSRESWQFRRAQIFEENLRDFMSNYELRSYYGRGFHREVERKQGLISKYNRRAIGYVDKRLKITNKIKKLFLCSFCIKPLIEYYQAKCSNNERHNICTQCKDKLDVLRNNAENTWVDECHICCQGTIHMHNTIYTKERIKIEKQHNTKLEHIHQLLNNPNKKFLVFSNFSSLFDMYLKDFKKNNIKYGILKGNNNVISKRLRDFKTGKTNVLLLNGKHYGSGLNLQDASDIIITHKISKDVETQVVGRANRMGRNGALNIHYIIFENERS